MQHQLMDEYQADVGAFMRPGTGAADAVEAPEDIGQLADEEVGAGIRTTSSACWTGRAASPRSRVHSVTVGRCWPGGPEGLAVAVGVARAVAEVAARVMTASGVRSPAGASVP